MQFQVQTEPEPETFACDTCGRSYTRLDHLTRHVRSHTQEKPFVCQQCGKAFARGDLLKRHELVHDSASPHKRQKITHEHRSRSARACIACARSKLRCDGLEPCSRCSKKQSTCAYKDSSMDFNRSHGSLVPKSVDSNTISYASQAEEDNNTGNVGTQWQDLPQPTEPDGQNNYVLPETHPSVETAASTIDFDDSYLADFLRDILNPSDALEQHSNNHDFVFAPRDFLDFTVPGSLDFFDGSEAPAGGYPVNLAKVDGHNELTSRLEPQPKNSSRSGYVTPTGRNGLSLGEQAFKESLWLWTPQQGDASADRANLGLPVDALVLQERAGIGEPSFPPLGQKARDQILAMVLDGCDHTTTATVVSCFPSAELLNVLIHKWLVYHTNQIDTWFHTGRFDPNEEKPELLIGMVAAGAALSKSAPIRKLGYAFQEATRAAHNSLFERDNRNIRKLKSYQSMALMLDIGLWSGDRRKVEIAESFAQPFVTMVRRGGQLSTTDYFPAMPSPNDDGASLDRKWAAWVEAQSMQRMVLHMLIRDCQSSASLLSPPLISFAEIKCPLPASRSLWKASTAQEWAEFLRGIQPASISLSIRSCLQDLPPSTAVRQQLDVDLAVLAISHAFWDMCWQYRQVEAVMKHAADDAHRHPSSANPMRQATLHKLQPFRLVASEWQPFSPEATLTCERHLMSLYVSLEDVQLLAGKAGEKEARRTFASLKHWAKGSDSRQAVWHAGQVIKAAREYPMRTLRDASAVAVYHAGLVFWAYAILTNADRSMHGLLSTDHEIVLNEDVRPDLERFVMLARGVPTIRAYSTATRATQIIALTDAKRVMSVIVDILQTNNEAKGEEYPPLVENLTKLMRSLGSAARSICVS